ncbi:hypothetical protein CGGC5_v005906 [Colletotrichum fructicola Nara gc5]|uniref:Uncharacterized protein n=1 Tax=Colletotrichum fructicola (strain Nara gc5) TaxID=1213859 RepID=A0A7J6JCG8_COLFN|nr:hypothetical protein CGGC5_v005906 [Colletotrichum fructicola Nara gc5]
MSNTAAFPLFQEDPHGTYPRPSLVHAQGTSQNGHPALPGIASFDRTVSDISGESSQSPSEQRHSTETATIPKLSSLTPSGWWAKPGVVRVPASSQLSLPEPISQDLSLTTLRSIFSSHSRTSSISAHHIPSPLCRPGSGLPYSRSSKQTLSSTLIDKTLSPTVQASYRPRRKLFFTTEQDDFIDYAHADCNIFWTEMEKLYAFVFSRDVALGIYRKPQALMERYRRLGRRFPVTDNQNLLVFDGNHDPRTLKIKDNKSINTSTGLLTVHPERALKYSWVSETHKMQVEQIGSTRRRPAA